MVAIRSTVKEGAVNGEAIEVVKKKVLRMNAAALQEYVEQTEAKLTNLHNRLTATESNLAVLTLQHKELERKVNTSLIKSMGSGPTVKS